MVQLLGKLKVEEEGLYGSKFYKFNVDFLKFTILKPFFFSSQKEDEIEEYLRKKYADETMATRHFGDGGEEMSDEITQQTLLPGVK